VTQSILGDRKIVSHPSDSSLEAYVMGHLSSPENSRLEEHILWCLPCQTRLEETAVYVETIRAGLVQMNSSKPNRLRARSRKEDGSLHLGLEKWLLWHR